MNAFYVFRWLKNEKEDYSMTRENKMRFTCQCSSRCIGAQPRLLIYGPADFVPRRGLRCGNRGRVASKAESIHYLGLCRRGLPNPSKAVPCPSVSGSQAEVSVTDTQVSGFLLTLARWLSTRGPLAASGTFLVLKGVCGAECVPITSGGRSGMSLNIL